MKGALKYPTIISFLLLVACDTSPSVRAYVLEAKELSYKLQQCRVNQVLPNECNDLRKKIARLEFEFQMNFDDPPFQRFNAALSLGNSEVSGDPDGSIYATVNNAYNILPLVIKNRIELAPSNYTIFSLKHCRKNESEELYQVAAFFQTPSPLSYRVSQPKRETYIYFYRLPSVRCLSLSALQERFLIITKSQLNQLITEFSSDDDVSILEFSSIGDALQSYEELEINR